MEFSTLHSSRTSSTAASEVTSDRSKRCGLLTQPSSLTTSPPDTTQYWYMSTSPCTLPLATSREASHIPKEERSQSMGTSPIEGWLPVDKVWLQCMLPV